MTNDDLPTAKTTNNTSWKILLLLVAMNGIAPVSLYILVPFFRFW